MDDSFILTTFQYLTVKMIKFVINVIVVLLMISCSQKNNELENQFLGEWNNSSSVHLSQGLWNFYKKNDIDLFDTNINHDSLNRYYYETGMRDEMCNETVFYRFDLEGKGEIRMHVNNPWKHDTLREIKYSINEDILRIKYPKKEFHKKKIVEFNFEFLEEESMQSALYLKGIKDSSAYWFVRTDSFLRNEYKIYCY